MTTPARDSTTVTTAMVLIAMMLLSTYGYATPDTLSEDWRQESKSAPTGAMTTTFNQTHVGWNDTILIHHALSGLSSSHSYEVSWKICEGNAVHHGCHDRAYEHSDTGQNTLFEGTHTVPTGVTSFLVIHTLHTNLTRSSSGGHQTNGTYTLVAQMISNTYVVDTEKKVFQTVGDGSGFWHVDDSPDGHMQPYLNQTAYMVNDPITAIVDNRLTCDPNGDWGIHWEIFDDATSNSVLTGSEIATKSCTHRYVYSRSDWNPKSSGMSRGVQLTSTGLAGGNYTVVLDLVQEDSGIKVATHSAQFQVLDVQFTGNEDFTVFFSNGRYLDADSDNLEFIVNVTGLAPTNTSSGTDIPYQIDWRICSGNYTRRGCYQQSYPVNQSGGQNEKARGSEQIPLGHTSDSITIQVSAELGSHASASQSQNGTHSLIISLTALSYTLAVEKPTVMILGQEGNAYWDTAKGRYGWPILDNSGYLVNMSISLDVRMTLSCDPTSEWRLEWNFVDTSDQTVAHTDGVEKTLACSAYYPWDRQHWHPKTPNNNNMLELTSSGLEAGDYRLTLSIIQNDSGVSVLSHSFDFAVVDVTLTGAEVMALSGDSNLGRHVPWGSDFFPRVNVTGLDSNTDYDVFWEVCEGDADAAGCRQPAFFLKASMNSILDHEWDVWDVGTDSESDDFALRVYTRMSGENNLNDRRNGTYSVIVSLRTETHTLVKQHIEFMVVGAPDAARWTTWSQPGGIPSLPTGAYLKNSSVELEVLTELGCSPASTWGLRWEITNLDTASILPVEWIEQSVSCEPYARNHKHNRRWVSGTSNSMLELSPGLDSGNYSVELTLVQNDSIIDVLSITDEFRVVDDWEVLDGSMIGLTTGATDELSEVYANFSMVNQLNDEWYNVDWIMVNSTDWTEIDNGTFGYLSISDEYVRNQTIVGVVGEGYCINATLRKGQDIIKDTASACSSAIQPPPDEDDDGVPDSADTCPGTEFNWTIDASGCAQNQIDDDGDGVFNHNDTCIGTDSANWTVDADGCADNQLDSDSDGVMNDIDQCSDTDQGATVDADGCSQLQLSDTDSDGVNDQDDECPSTPATDVPTVNDIGCGSTERDGDGDGWVDAEDDCPNTPPGGVIEDRGCQSDTIDTDQDGIVDINDLCPNTPGGPIAMITVDADGCAESQKDDDGDLVMNDVDNCTETDSANWTADAEGCAPNQLDSDTDGITNDLDICPTSSFGAIVDVVGCEDSDGDSVNEYNDTCPGTLTTEATLVDEFGCGPSQRDTDGDTVNDADDLCPEVAGLTKRGGCPPNTPPVCSVYASAKVDGIDVTGDAILPTLDLTIIPTIDLPTGEYYLILKCWDEDGSNVTVNLNGIEETGEEVVLGTLVSVDENTEPMDVNAQFSDGETTKTISLRVRFSSDSQATPGFGAIASFVALLGAASAIQRRRD